MRLRELKRDDTRCEALPRPLPASYNRRILLQDGQGCGVLRQSFKAYTILTAINLFDTIQLHNLGPIF